MVVYSGMLLLAVAARAAAAVPGMLLLALAARAAAAVPVTNATVPLWTSNSSCEYVRAWPGTVRRVAQLRHRIW